MAEQDNQAAPERITRIVDFRLPLPWVVTIIVASISTVVAAGLALRQMSSDVEEIKIAIKSGNSQLTTLQGHNAILDYRVNLLEAEVARIKGQPAPPIYQRR